MNPYPEMPSLQSKKQGTPKDKTNTNAKNNTAPGNGQNSSAGTGNAKNRAQDRATDDASRPSDCR